MENILVGIFWILAIYGFIEIVKNIIYILTYTKMKAEGIFVIIAAKNQENIIEVFLRTSLFRMIYGKEDILKNILVTDLDSKDTTKAILKKISDENTYIKYLPWKDCKELIDNIDNV